MYVVSHALRRALTRLWPLAGMILAFGGVGAGRADAATTYYVAPTGSDSNNGSQSAPFRQIRAALKVVHAGDTVLVSDGSYLGFDVDSLSGTATAPITIKAVGTNATVTTTTDRSDNRDTIFVTYSSYIVLDGLRAFNANRAAVRVDNSPNITVKNGVYGNNATWGIFTDFSDNLLIAYNECYGSVAQHGIYVSNSCINPIVRGNTSHDNYMCGIHMNGDLSEGGTGLITGGLVEDNILYNNGAGGGSAINMDGVQNTTVRNNLLFNNHSTGIANYQIDGAAGPKGNQILNNTVDMASNSRWALLFKSTAGLNTVRDNILYNEGTYRGGLDCGASSDVANVDSDYNIMDRVTTDDGNTVYTLAQWQAKGHEPHSLSATPAGLWVNQASSDYHLRAGSPAIDAGQTLSSVTNDIEGNPRPVGAASDIGCYEYQGSVLSLASISVSPSSVTGGTTAQGTVTLSGAAPSGGVIVTLSSNSASAQVPASVTVAANTTAATFPITTSAVTANTTATLSAVYNGVTRTTTLTVQAPASVTLSSITINPTSVTGGTSAQGTVTLSGKAPSTGAVVTLSSNSASATVPASVTVASGATSATFSITTKTVTANTTATISATYSGVTQKATLTLTPAVTSQTLTDIADAYVKAGSDANTNFGTHTQLVVKNAASNSSNIYNRCSYLKFDLTHVTTAPSSAILTIQVDSGSSPAGATETVKVYGVADTSWTETGITWNNAPGLNRTNFTSTGTFLTSKGVVLQAGAVTFDVTAYVKANIGKVVTLQLIDETAENLFLTFNSREAASNPPTLTLH